MTDIVERLRHLHKLCDCWSEYEPYDMVMLKEAADEIERLRNKEKNQINYWRPMASAPKNGTRILACWVDGDFNKFGTEHTIIEWFQYSKEDRGSWCQRQSGLGADHGYGDAAFSHWMPLPLLPTNLEGRN